jgi:hypothetical protein
MSYSSCNKARDDLSSRDLFEYSAIDIAQLSNSSLSLAISSFCVVIVSVNPLTSFLVVENRLTNQAQAAINATTHAAIAVIPHVAIAIAIPRAVTATVTNANHSVLPIND